MSKGSLRSHAAAVLSEGETGERFVDLGIELREHTSKAEIITVGGRWDRQENGWCDEPHRRVVWEVQPAQYEAAHFFADWLEAYAEGKRVPGFETVYTMLTAGGRGSGKSDFGIRAGVMTAVAAQGRIVWFVSPVEDETEELRRVVSDITPPEFYAWLKSDQAFYFWNRSTVSMLSGYDPGTLKRGRVDYFLLNEAQRFPKKAYTMVRPRLADTGGLGYMAANPPSEPKGRWVMDFYDRAKAGKLPGVRLFELDPGKNPFIDRQALEVLRPEFGDEDYRREILGEMLPIGDLVFYAWSDLLDVGNIRPMPDIGDITEEMSRKEFGRPFANVFGVDLQLAPHMASPVTRFFANDENPARPLSWYHDCFAVAGTEDDLVDAWEGAGYRPDENALVVDASGWWQDAERNKGRASVDVFKRRGWKWVYRPDKKAKKNPPVVERILATNARFCSGAGAAARRYAFSVPENLELNQALKMWENRNGIPYKRSDFAHLCDAASYVQIRFFPRRRVVKSRVGYEGGRHDKSERASELDYMT